MRSRFLGGTACILFLSSAFAAPAPPDSSPARMDQIVQYYVDKQQFMGAVLVARGDTVLFSKAYGSANLEWGIPNTTTTKFRIGSITKQFTAAAVLLLEERGKLRIEDPVKKYYSDAPAAWDKITLFHLLTHTAGLPNYLGGPGSDSLTAQHRTSEELVKRFRDLPLDFEPGTEQRYSNSGYALLGLVIEKTSGTSYGNFLDENIFKPLGMKDSVYDDDWKIIPQRADGYGVRAGEFANVAHIEATAFGGAGGLYSTVEDLLRWERGLFLGKLLSEASLKKMTTPFKRNYAFGLAVGELNGARQIVHGGSIYGFKAKLAYYPDDAITVVALSNIPAPAAETIVDKLGGVVHGKTVVLQSERVEIAVSPDTLQQYLGAYELRPGFNLVFAVVENRLTVTGGGGRPDPLFADSKDRFFSKLADADFEFVRDSAKKVTHVVLHQGGTQTKAKRKE